MQHITLNAHYDGTCILLDEPFELQPHTKLLVTVLCSEPADEAWYDLSMHGLNAAYGDDEPEYPLTLIKEPNPDYERG